MIDTIRSRFKSFTKNGYYVKADTDSFADWNIGLDGKGFQSLKLRGTFKPQSVEESKIIGINQYQKEDKHSIVFSLLNDKFEQQFYFFCEDLISSTKDYHTDEECYEVAVSCFKKWKKMFKNSTSRFLSEIEIMGLIAEVLFLKDYMIPKYGEANSVKSWTGQELTKKDFSIEDKWFEVKAVSKGKNSVKISSLEQLDGDGEGSLIVYPMEKMSSVSSAVGLNELINEVYESIVDEEIKERFIDKVFLQGFVFHDYYDEHKYSVGPFRNFSISEAFPRLTPDSVPKLIVKVEYEIDINGLAEYEV